MSSPPRKKKYTMPPSESVDRLLASTKLADATKRVYLERLGQYLRAVKKSPDEFVKSVRSHPRKFEEEFVRFIRETAKKSGSSTTAAYRDSVKRFLELNRVDKINWEYVNEFVPAPKKFGQDRAPTTDEVRKMVDVADLRTKCLALFLCSSGARIGSVPYLRWRDVEDVEVDGVKFGKVTIYRGEPEEYITFVTPECLRYWAEYKQWREGIGEKVNGESYVFVTQGNATNFDPNKVKPAKPKTLGNMLGKVLKAMRMRSVIGERGNYKNYEFKQAHGFRKFFKTRLEVGGVKPLVIETLMGHNTGLSRSYFKPTWQELAKEYVKAIDNLTIIEKKVEKPDLRSAFREQLMLVAGFKQEDITKLDLSKVSDEELQQMVREKLLGAMTNNGNRQKIVSVSQVETALAQGWEFVASLPGEKAILKLPSQ